MSMEFVVSVAKDAIVTTLLLGLPVLGLGLVVGVAISILQAATQIHEQTLTFVPKIVAVFVALLIFGPWMLRVILDFSQRMLTSMPAAMQ
ncbi:MAG TPA: flagellar biosynthesis protein FliQ [Clostridia bacterium]|nr:flagellar biosynthesis protein FliQ [Clostridia bacterium]